ncbi:MAG: hypothetical protein ABIT76_08760 [Chthoniobacterales bacterium]
MAKSEKLLTCPDCGQPNFLARGLKAHRGTKTCLKNAEAGWQETDAALETTPAVVAVREVTLAVLDSLPPMRRVKRGEPVSIETLEQQISDLLSADFARELAWRNESIYDRVAIGLCLLKGRELHLDISGRPKKSGNVSALSKADKKKQEKAELGFYNWLEERFPNFNRRTATNYMNAARNCGLTSDHSLEDVDALKTAQALHDKTSKDLYRLVDTLKTTTPEDNTPPPDLIADWQLSFFDVLDTTLTVRDDLTPEQYEATHTRLHATLEKLTGMRWVMTSDPVEEEGEHGSMSQAPQ